MISDALAGKIDLIITKSVTGSVFSGKIFCGDCGKTYGPKVWHSTDPYRRVIWQCNAKFKDKSRKCSTPHLTEEQIKSAYVTALSLLIVDRERFLEDGRLLQSALTDATVIDREIAKINLEIESIAQEIKRSIADNASTAQDQKGYRTRHSTLAARYEKLKEQLKKLRTEKNERAYKATVLGGFLFEIRELPDLNIAFSETRFRKTVDRITVYNDGRLTFRFLIGKEITVEI